MDEFIFEKHKYCYNFKHLDFDVINYANTLNITLNDNINNTLYDNINNLNNNEINLKDSIIKIKEYMYILSAFTFLKIDDSKIITYKLCGYDFDKFFITHAYIYFIGKENIYCTEKRGFMGFEVSPLHKIQNIETFSVYNTCKNMLLIANHKNIVIFDGPLRHAYYPLDIQNKLTVEVKVVNNKIIIFTGNGKCIQVADFNNPKNSFVTLFDLKCDLIQYGENEKCSYMINMRGEQLFFTKIDINTKKTVIELEIKDVPVNFLIYKNYVILHLKQNIVILDGDLKILREKQEYFEIKQIKIFDDHLFVCYEFGLIEEIDLKEIVN